jgi:hypothetical protein
MRAAVAIVVAALCSSQVIAADEFCDHLNAYGADTKTVQFSPKNET